LENLFFDLRGAKRRHSQSYDEHLQRGNAKKERDKITWSSREKYKKKKAFPKCGKDLFFGQVTRKVKVVSPL
jgi:hypothetical protein